MSCENEIKSENSIMPSADLLDQILNEGSKHWSKHTILKHSLLSVLTHKNGSNPENFILKILLEKLYLILNCFVILKISRNLIFNVD